MATEKQLQANRQNALKSTGPRSLAGKMIASRNSTRHGFYATSILLPEEDREEFLYLARRLVSAYNPSGVREEELVRTIIETRWQLRRANLVDSELFQIYGFYKGQNRGVGTAFAQDAVQGNAFSKLTRYQSFLLRKLHLTEQELSRVKAEAAGALRPAQPALVLNGPEIEVSNGVGRPQLPVACSGQVPVGADSPQSAQSCAGGFAKFKQKLPRWTLLSKPN